MSIFDFFSRKSEPATLPFETDVHCHVLPGVDDGSPDVETSCRLIEQMNQWGIRNIIATPHITADTFENTPDTLDPALESLTAALVEKNIPVSVIRSSENRIDDFFVDQLKAGNIRPLPGNHLLLENPWLQEAWQLDNLLFNLKVQGFKTIIAHPERYPYYSQTNRDRYKQLHSNGNLFQVNLLSLAGHYGKLEKTTAEYLVESGMADFIGTDLHHEYHVASINNYLTTRDAHRIFDQLRGHLMNEHLWSLRNKD